MLIDFSEAYYNLLNPYGVGEGLHSWFYIEKAQKDGLIFESDFLYDDLNYMPNIDKNLKMIKFLIL